MCFDEYLLTFKEGGDPDSTVRVGSQVEPISATGYDITVSGVTDTRPLS